MMANCPEPMALASRLARTVGKSGVFRGVTLVHATGVDNAWMPTRDVSRPLLRVSLPTTALVDADALEHALGYGLDA